VPTFDDQEMLPQVITFMLESMRWRPVSLGGTSYLNCDDATMNDDLASQALRIVRLGRFNCLSEGAFMQQQQDNLFKDCGLDFTLLQSDKLVYVETDTSDDHLGLDKELYQKVCLNSSVIELTKNSIDLHVCHLPNNMYMIRWYKLCIEICLSSNLL
jgi:hypothetical protein